VQAPRLNNDERVKVRASMTIAEPHFARFLRAVHRRLIVARAVERAGICAAVATGFALIFTGAMLWRGDNGLALALATILLGASIGLVWGLVRRPAITDAAFAADRQLQLSDLLATALSFVSSDDPWRRAVVAVADQRCRTLSADAVIVRKLGGRAWGGIGLAAALVLTLGALSALPADTRAKAGATSEAQVAPAMAQAPVTHRGSANPDVVPPPQALGSTDIDASSEPADTNSAATAPHLANAAVAANGNSMGTTSSHADVEPLPSAESASSDPPASSGNLQAADSSAAGGVTGQTDPTGTGRAGMRAGAGSASGEAAPWQSSSWQSDRQAALREVENSQVPASYRDVVREYFRAGER
jgi:hypothetical protein